MSTLYCQHVNIVLSAGRYYSAGMSSLYCRYVNFLPLACQHYAVGMSILYCRYVSIILLAFQRCAVCMSILFCRHISIMLSSLCYQHVKILLSACTISISTLYYQDVNILISACQHCSVGIMHYVNIMLSACYEFKQLSYPLFTINFLCHMEEEKLYIYPFPTFWMSCAEMIFLKHFPCWLGRVSWILDNRLPEIVLVFDLKICDRTHNRRNGLVWPLHTKSCFLQR